MIGAVAVPADAAAAEDVRRISRDPDAGMIAGVCAGIADRLGWSTTRVRVAFVLLGLFGAGELLYLVLWILMPKA